MSLNKPVLLLSEESLRKSGLKGKAASTALSGFIVCPCELGFAVICSADSASLCRSLSETAVRCRWARPLRLLLSGATNFWSLWRPEMRTPESETLLDTCWPGPLAVQGIASDFVVDHLRVGQKVLLWQPGHNLCRLLVKCLDRPLAGIILPGPGRLLRNSQEAITYLRSILGDNLRLYVDGGEPGWLEETELDITGNFWRITKIGMIGAQELERVTSKPVLLSGDNVGTTLDKRALAAKLILFSGDPGRLSRRISHYCENLDIQDTVAFLLYSPSLKESLQHSLQNMDDYFTAEMHDIYPCKSVEDGGDSDSSYNRQLLQRIFELRCREEVRLVIMEAPPADGNYVELSEQLEHLAHQVISVDRLANGSLLTSDNCDEEREYLRCRAGLANTVAEAGEFQVEADLVYQEDSNSEE